MTRILIAYDGSESARRALEYRERVETDDEVAVISVVPKLIEGPPTEAYTDPASPPKEVRKLLEEAVAILGEAGVAAESILVIGNPAAEILDHAETRGIELIVIGRAGRHGIKRFLMGTVSDRVVEHARCDVLVVR
jgi:nucleotide-binding universal stress UspA family protein